MHGEDLTAEEIECGLEKYNQSKIDKDRRLIMDDTVAIFSGKEYFTREGEKVYICQYWRMDSGEEYLSCNKKGFEDITWTTYGKCREELEGFDIIKEAKKEEKLNEK